VRAPRSDSGYTRHFNYTLLGAFSRAERDKAAQARSSEDDDELINIAAELREFIDFTELDAP
jgi:hypothetical protein